MNELVFPYSTTELTRPRLGLIALQSDETIEMDLQRLCPDTVELMVSRVVSDTEVSSDTLAAMEGALSAAASLFPQDMCFNVLGYGCTSGTAQIGADTVARNIRQGVGADVVTNPLTALVAACRALGVQRLAILSPYVSQVSARLRAVLADEGIETPVFGSFDVANEATVVRIDAASIISATLSLMQGADVDAVFLSCTNLRTLDVIAPLEKQLNKPVLTSNQVLAWHMLLTVKAKPAQSAPGRLFINGRR